MSSQTNCDDGNGVGEDGCSDLCLIEDNFDCDITYCWETIPPYPEITDLSSNLEITITFSEPIKTDATSFILNNLVSRIEGS